jgi:hypothetical protein
MGPKVANCRGYLNNGLSHTGSKNGGVIYYDEIGIFDQFAEENRIFAPCVGFLTENRQK